MSIIIRNIGPVGDHTDPDGRWRYEVRINDELITTFTHRRSSGLASCLETASFAVRRTDRGQKRVPPSPRRLKIQKDAQTLADHLSRLLQEEARPDNPQKKDP